MTSPTCKFYERFSLFIVTYTELFFYRLGCKVASKPLTTIAICWGLVFISAAGFFRFHQEKNPMKLWVPPYTTFVDDTNWLISKVDRGYRTQAAIAKAPDVLTPEVIIELAELDVKVRSSKTKLNVTWKDVCFKIPEIESSIVTFFYKPYRKSKSNNDLDPSVDMNSATYCSFVESMGEECYEKSILELWRYDLRKIRNLTKEDILFQLNTHKDNPVFNKLKNYEDLLGGIIRNESGHIVGAKTIHNFWMASVNFSAIDMDKSGNMAGTADWASEQCLDWEEEFTNLMENASKHSKHFNLYYSAARNFGDISNSVLFQDMDVLVIGIVIMVIYVQFVISKFNWLEARLVLGTLGLLTVGMSFVVAVGLCSAIGISYGPVHTSLPFLLMGLGVDDMFVIMACYEGLSPSQKRLPLHERVGLMLKHGGISITVTSVTDVLAFIVGSSTILPCLESYCIYAAVGVMMTFIFAVTFFTACFTLDERRIADKRNGALPCIRKRTYSIEGCSQDLIAPKVFDFVYSKIIFSFPGKLFVILVTAVCFGFSVQCVFRLEQRFDPLWFVPESTHLAKYIEERKAFYPLMGYEAGVYMGALNYSQEILNIRDMVEWMEKSPDIVTGDINSWIQPFRQFVKRNFKKDIYSEILPQTEFNLFLSKFLFSPYTARFQANFKFERPLECGIPAPNITMSVIDFRFNHFKGPEEYLPAMHRVVDTCKSTNFTTGDKFVTVWSKVFATWITDEVIDIEVLRNLELALLCVMICTVLLIANLQICFWVFVCIILTMVNVCGFMQRWGLTIDLVSCIGLELAIGLCVDYATHIGHTFLTIREGTKTERALKTVTSIGSAVLFGGLSTLIGVSMLSQSQAYTFQTFFKIFLLVILFGLYHGVVLLPVILSWIGPSPYQQTKNEIETIAI